jgi:hypothetical protein
MSCCYHRYAAASQFRPAVAPVEGHFTTGMDVATGVRLAHTLHDRNGAARTAPRPVGGSQRSWRGKVRPPRQPSCARGRSALWLLRSPNPRVSHG